MGFTGSYSENNTMEEKQWSDDDETREDYGEYVRLTEWKDAIDSGKSEISSGGPSFETCDEGLDNVPTVEIRESEHDSVSTQEHPGLLYAHND